MAKENTSKRTRNFAGIVYPESAPPNWIELLSEMRIPAFISPLHDQDTNPGGEAKKPHFHVVLMFDSVKTREQAEEVFKLIGAVGCEVIQSIRDIPGICATWTIRKRHSTSRKTFVVLLELTTYQLSVLSWISTRLLAR